MTDIMKDTRRTFLATAGAAAGGLAFAGPASAFLNTETLLGVGAAAVQGFTMGEGHEIQIGEQYYEQYLLQSGGRYPDRNAQEALKRFAAPLIATSDREKLPWDIALVGNDQVNAWALPGGKMAINSALVQVADDPNELASVIAHEIGHAELAHGLSQMRNQTFMSAASTVAKPAVLSQLGAAAPLGAEALAALEGPIFQLITAGYSRSNEFEADQHILHVFGKTGMDPDRADDFFHTLQAVYPRGSNETTSLFSTHPVTSERITAIEKTAAGMGGHGRSSALPGWAELKAIFPTPERFRKG